MVMVVMVLDVGTFAITDALMDMVMVVDPGTMVGVFGPVHVEMGSIGGRCFASRLFCFFSPALVWPVVQKNIILLLTFLSWPHIQVGLLLALLGIRLCRVVDINVLRPRQRHLGNIWLFC